MKFVIRNNRYSHGKRPGFIVTDPKFVQLGEWEEQQEQKTHQQDILTSQGQTAEIGHQQSDNLTVLHKFNYPTTNALEWSYFSSLHSIQIGKDCVTS